MTRLKVKESDIQSVILDFLKASKYWHARVSLGGLLIATPTGIRYKKNPMKGFPDIILTLKNRPATLVGVELKSATGRLSQEQLNWSVYFQQHSIPWICPRSFSDFIEKLQSLERMNEQTVI